MSQTQIIYTDAEMQTIDATMREFADRIFQIADDYASARNLGENCENKKERILVIHSVVNSLLCFLCASCPTVQKFPSDFFASITRKLAIVAFGKINPNSEN